MGRIVLLCFSDTLLRHANSTESVRRKLLFTVLRLDQRARLRNSSLLVALVGGTEKKREDEVSSLFGPFCEY